MVLLAARRYLADPGSPYGDDCSSHLALVSHLAGQIRAGQVGLWFDQTNLGFALFLSYPPLPALVTAALAAALAPLATATLVFKAMVVSLWAAMPAAYYIGGRWLGLSRRQAAALGLLVLAVHDPLNVGLSPYSVLYKGLFAQSFGLLCLPFCVGMGHRVLVGGEPRWRALAGLFALLLLCHVLVGLMAGLALLVLLAVAREGRLRGLRQLLLAGAAAFALVAAWAIPVLLHRAHVGGLPWKGEVQNGWPAAKLAKLLLSGELVDSGRFPGIMLLAMGGLWVALRRRGEPVVRFTLGLGAAALFMLLGRTNLGPLYDLIPLHRDINVSRYVVLLQLALLLLASLAVATLLEALPGLLARWSALGRWPALARSPARLQLAAGAVAVLVAGGYLAERQTRLHSALRSFDTRAPELDELVRHLGRDRGHRFAVHPRLGTHDHFHRDLLPSLAGRPQLASYGLGFHATHSIYFVDSVPLEPDMLRLYAVNALVAKKGRRPPRTKGLAPAFSNARYTVFELAPPDNARASPAGTTGYVELVRLPLVVSGRPKEVRRFVKPLLGALWRHRALPRWADRAPAGARPGTTHVAASAGAPPQELVDDVLRRHGSAPPAGRVLADEHGTGEHRARVEIPADARGEWLLFKVSYDPWWRGTVDGKEVDVVRAGPNLMAVPVGPGLHEVRFVFRVPRHPLALALGGVLVGVLLVVTGARRRPSRAPVPGPAPRAG